MAQAYNVPSTMHDCTGPLTLIAGLHINASVAGCCFQETVRAHVRSFYSQLIEPNVRIEAGFAFLPQGPGLGVKLNPDLFCAWSRWVSGESIVKGVLIRSSARSASSRFI